ncbi:MAG: ABC transporter ATP-binding protein [Betaproteobacteria bacterium]|nr:MAG: ABC transporter ATP-binding protein [Betaproteobacteria bacterium]
MAEASDDRPLLQLAGVHLHFGGLVVLNGISLDLQRGELLALIGPNGAGKTSVLNCISLLYRPTQGRIVFEGEDLAGLSPHGVARRGIARTFQLGGLFPHLTVLQNLLVGRHAHFSSNVVLDGVFWGRARANEIAQRAAAEEIIEFFELERHRGELVSKLPFGVQKIVGFARALAMEPRLLLLDEPSAGLNREAREDLSRFILRIKHEKGIGMIWVEHDMQMVADLADRIYVMDYGAHIADGEPRQILADPRVVEIYLGSKGN